MLTPANAAGTDKEVELKPTTNPREPSVNEEGNLTTTIVSETKIHTIQDVENLTPWVENVESSSLNAILAAHTGSTLHGTYYSGILAKDSITAAVSEDISSAYQQYCKIKGMPIYLEGEIDTTIESTTKIAEAVATATIIGPFVPNISDYIVLPFGFNKESLFKVDEVKPLAIWKGAHEVTFSLVETVVAEQHQQLEKKTARTFNYIRKNHRLGVKYLLTDEELTAELAREKMVSQLERVYIARFLDRDSDLLLCPVPNDLPLIDMELQDFVQASFVCHPNLYSDGSYTEKQTTIYGRILAGDHVSMLKHGMVYAHYAWSKQRTDNPRLYGLMHANISYLMTQKGTLNGKIAVGHMESFHVQDGTEYEGKFSLLQEIYPVEKNTDKYRLFPNVAGNSSYVFSVPFYESQLPTNILEETVLQYLTDGTCNFNRLNTLLVRIDELNDIEAYYLVPLMIVILRIAKDSKC